MSQRTSLPIGLVVILFFGPFDAKAQVGGNPLAQGGTVLRGSDNTFSQQAGNPLDFHSTIQFGYNGLTATGDASNDHVFQSNGAGVGAAESLSLSGTVIGANNAWAELDTTASISGMGLGHAPATGADYFYFWQLNSLKVTGMLAPGDSASFLVDISTTNATGAGGPVFDATTGLPVQFSFSETFTNTTATAQPLSFAAGSRAGYLGDWFGIRSDGNFPVAIGVDVQEFIFKTNTSSPDASWISVDPGLSVRASNSPQSLPEPSSAVLMGAALFCGMLYVARRRMAHASRSHAVGTMPSAT